jgi:maleate isomerase
MIVQLIEPTGMVWVRIPYHLDGGIGTRAHIGMVVISNDQTLSHEARAMLTLPGVALFEARIMSSRARNQPVTADVLKLQTEKIDLAVQQINSMRSPDVVAIGCTSAAMMIGPERQEQQIRRILPQARVTDPYTGIRAALKASGARRVGFLSPYLPEIAQRMVSGIEAAGVEVRIAGSFHNEGGVIGDEAPFISPQSIAEAVHQLVAEAELDTVVIACTQMRAAALIERLEQETGKTIISSNQAMCWHALRLAGCTDSVPGWGRLLMMTV